MLSRLYKYPLLSALVGLGSMQGSGFILNEQSLNGTALNSAYVAGAFGADSAYYNPANMAFDENDGNELEINATMLFIPGFDFTTAGRDKGEIATGAGAALGPNRPAGPAVVNGKANPTYAFVPKMFFKTKGFEDEMIKSSFGLSVTTPSGLTMDWDGEGGKFLDKVGIGMIEINPVMALAFNNRFSLGGGIRFIYASGEFDNTLYVPYKVNGAMGMDINIDGTNKTAQKSETSAWGVGFNFAASLKITDKTMLSATYRTKTHFDMKGKLSAVSYVTGGILAGNGTVNMDADLRLSTDIPDTLRVALAHRFDKLLAEFVYERVFWKGADIFEFEYSNHKFSNPQGFNPGFENTIIAMAQQNLNGTDYNAVAMGRGWRNSQAFRLGLSYFYSPKLKLMGSLAFDGTPVPQGKDRFGIPDADSYMLGLGARYDMWDGKADVGIAYSLALKDNTKSFIQSKHGLGQLHLVTLGAKYRF